MLNNKFVVVTLFLVLCNPVLAHAESEVKCIPEEMNFVACETLAQKGDDDALVMVGRFYETGTGVKKISKRQKKFISNLRIKTVREGLIC